MLKMAAFGLFAAGLAGIGLAVPDYLDSRINFCDTFTNPCTPRTVPGWAELPQDAKFVKILPGAVGAKLLGAGIGLAGFVGSMMLCRLLAEEEVQHQRFRAVSDNDALRRYNARVEADFEAYVHEANLRAAEVAYAVLAPYQQPLLEGDAMEDVTNPADKIPAAAVEVPEPQPETAAQPTWLKGFLSSTCLVWGNQGSGKSWFVRLLVQHKKQMGYRVIVFDPNSNKSEWQGVELFNDYQEIEQQMQWYVDEVMGRYEVFGKSDIAEDQWRKNLWAQGKAATVVCEEMTTYADFISDKELLAKFVKVAATLSRKQEMPVIFVTHNNTQSCLGDIKGLANLINRMQQIQLIAETDPKTSQPVASGRASIKMDGSDTWTEVETPKIDKKIKDFRKESEKSDDNRNYLDRVYNLEFKLDDRPVSNPGQMPENAKHVLAIIESATRYPISFEAIRKSRKWGDNPPEKKALIEALTTLLLLGKIEGDEETGYSPTGSTGS